MVIFRTTDQMKITAQFLKRGLRKPVLRLYADRVKVVVEMRGGSDNRLADLV